MATQEHSLPGEWYFESNLLVFQAGDLFVRIAKYPHQQEVIVNDDKKWTRYMVSLLPSGDISSLSFPLVRDSDGDLSPFGDSAPLTPDERRRLNYLLHMAAGRATCPFPNGAKPIWKTTLEMCASPVTRRHTRHK